MGIIDCVFPPHDQHLRKELFNRAIRAWPCDASGVVNMMSLMSFHVATSLSDYCTTRTVISTIHAYFGSQVAMYFVFMDHFTAWLVPPALFGLAIAVWNYVDMSVNGT